MDQMKKTAKMPPEPPKDKDGRPMAPPDGKMAAGQRPEPPKDANGRPMAPPDGKMAPPDGKGPGRPGDRPQIPQEESVSVSAASSQATTE